MLTRIKMWPGFAFGCVQFLCLAWGAVGNMMPEFVPFHRSLILSVPEFPRTPVGQSIYTFQGLDWDDDRLSFQLHSETDQLPFEIKQESGKTASLIVTKPLDRETAEEFRFTVTVTDSRVKTPTALPVKVLLTDVNDNYPEFKTFKESFSVPEGSPVPLVVSTFSVIDLDEGPNGALTYFIQDNPPNLKLVPVQGGVQLVLIEPLDYEKAALYKIQLIARDNPVDKLEKQLETSINLTIFVGDVNDNPPVFKMPRVAQIGEKTPPNSNIFRVLAADGDAGVNSPILYKLVSESSHFSLDPEGSIITQRVFNLSSDPARIYRLVIRATEQDEMKYYTDAEVIIKIIGPWGSPKFRNESYQGSIRENSPVGYPVQLKPDQIPELFDYDIDSLDQVTLSLQGPSSDIFQIYPQTGYGSINWQIFVKNDSKLDFEAIQVFTFQILAVDTGGNRTAVDVTVFLLDTNDNPPKFRENLYNVTIHENPSPGTVICNVIAEDPDSGPYGEVRYTRLLGSAQSDLSLNQTSGEITVKFASKFDYEATQHIFMTVQACDMLGTGICAEAALIINLLDENDNSPKFTQPGYQAHIYEGQTGTILNVFAQDADQKNTSHSLVTYSLQSADPRSDGHLQINPNTGWISIIKPFDFELLSKFVDGAETDMPANISLEFVLTAGDGAEESPKRTSVILTVILSDVDDSRPKFDRKKAYFDRIKEYWVPLREDAPEKSPVLQLTCLDSDISRLYSSVVYTIGGNMSNSFHINATSGLITVAHKLQWRKRHEQFKFTAHCFHPLHPDQGDIANVTVRVDDVNDTPPRFQTGNGTGSGSACGYSAVLPENTEPDFEVLLVSAEDLDSWPNLVYSIDYPNSRAWKAGKSVNLKIEDFLAFREQAIVTENLIDYEIVDKVELEVIVTDIAAKINFPQEDMTRVCVDISNMNDVVPRFSKSRYIVSVVEGTALNTHILTVTALGDKEFGVTYKLKDTVPFGIDPVSGAIRVSGRIDREVMSQYNFRVVASSGKDLSDEARVYVQIEDANDNPPYFTFFLENVVVFENASVGSVITNVQASDLDTGSYGKVNYLLEGDSGPFRIDYETGSLVVSQPLNRNLKNSFELNVVAIDNDPKAPCGVNISQKTGKIMKITVLDVNDHSPQVHFKEEKDVYEIWDNATLNTVILSFFLSDDDEPGTPNAETTVHILNPEMSELFQVKEEAAPLEGNVWWNVRPRKILTDMGGYYTLVLNVSDQGSPPNVIIVRIIIQVKNTNPIPGLLRFSRQIFTASVTTDDPPGRELIQLQLQDYRDKVDASWETSGRPQFSLEGEDAGLFRIHPESGVVSVGREVAHGSIYRLRGVVSWLASSNNHTIRRDDAVLLLCPVENGHKFVQRTSLVLNGRNPWSVAYQLQNSLEELFNLVINVEPEVAYTNGTSEHVVNFVVCVVVSPEPYQLLSGNQVEKLLNQTNAREIRKMFKFVENSKENSEGLNDSLFYWFTLEEIQLLYFACALVIIIACLALNTILSFGLTLLEEDRESGREVKLVRIQDLPAKIRKNYSVDLDACQDGKLREPKESEC